MDKLYVPARVMDKKWAELFVKGQIFMRSLTEFGAWEAIKHHSNAELNNSFRGDWREGSIMNISAPDDDRMFSAFPADLKQFIKDGTILDANDIQYFNTLCLCCVDYLPEMNMFAPPSIKMKEFGDTAVIIKDMNEFLRRLWIGIEKHFPDFCLLMDKVEYYNQGETKRLNPLFNKSTSYRYQNELRIAIGRLDKNRPTVEGKHELCQSTEPLKFEIGDISDITQMMSVDDFCVLKNMEQPILPMIDRRSDIFIRLISDTRAQMRQFKSRQQTILFSV